jgi:hypothetical protein
LTLSLSWGLSALHVIIIYIYIYIYSNKINDDDD